jgi:subtilisin family serine protease
MEHVIGVLLLLFLSYSLFSPAMVPVKEQRIKIAVIDTGFDIMRKDLRPFLCASGHRSLADDDALRDSHPGKHGTNVAGLIAKNLDPAKQCLLIIKYWKLGSEGDSEINNVINAVDYAISQKVSYINLSIGGTDENRREIYVLNKALKHGIKIAVAAGNESMDLNAHCLIFPACYASFFDENLYHVVGSFTKHNGHDYSNRGDIVRYLEDGTEVGNPVMTGTSQATAIHTGRWASGQLK